MPKLINHADRVEGIREAVYVVTLEKGVAAISLAAVADWLHVSPRTVQRMMSSTEALPRLGLQWADMRQRLRLVNAPARARAQARTRAEGAVDAMLETMPGREDAQDRHVWWALVHAHEATCDWARAERGQHETFLARLSGEVVADLPADVRDFEARRLHLLVSGAITHICSGAFSYDEAAAVIRRHVLGLQTDQSQPNDDAA